MIDDAHILHDNVCMWSSQSAESSSIRSIWFGCLGPYLKHWWCIRLDVMMLNCDDDRDREAHVHTTLYSRPHHYQVDGFCLFVKMVIQYCSIRIRFCRDNSLDTVIYFSYPSYHIYILFYSSLSLLWCMEMLLIMIPGQCCMVNMWMSNMSSMSA